MIKLKINFRILLTAFCCCLAIFTLSCKKDNLDDNKPNTDPVEEGTKLNTIPEFFKEAPESAYGKTAPELKVIAGAAQNIKDPQDLDFHSLRPEELWVINKETANTGGTTVTIANANSDNRTFTWLQDGNAWHFMALPTAMAFSNNGNWASSSGIFSSNHNSMPYTGPTLWSGDLSIYAQDPGQGLNGSHLDMLHQSPYGMGIAAEVDNVFWVFDGYNENIVRYDFVDDHGPGYADHSDGKVHRYTEAKVKRSDVPSHMILDKTTNWLYIANTADKNIRRLNIKTGEKYMDLVSQDEPLAEYWDVRGASWEIFAEGGLNKPCGIEINQNRLFVSDYETGEIIAYSLESKQELGRINTGKKGIAGLKTGPDGKLWYVNSLSNELVKIEPK